jgi:uncharacterized protein (TIGR02265 family)
MSEKVDSDAAPPSSWSEPTDGRPRPWLDDPTLSLRERLNGAPSDGRVKGWLFQSVIDNAKRSGIELSTTRRYLGFKDYHVTEYLELLGQASVMVRPGQPARDTLRLLGRGVFDSFSGSLFGKVVLSGLGRDHSGARTGLRWVTQVYKMTSNHAVARFTESGDDVAVIDLDNVWSFPDAYHVGVFEGAARGFGGDVRVDIKGRSLSAATLTFTWLGR